jgi:hypothetical protein
MALPTTFATLSGGNQPLALLDTQFAAVAALGSIPCAAAGQNTIALTPFSGTPTVSSYPDLAPSFVFAAAQTSNGSVTINAALVGARNAYKWNAVGNGSGVGAGDIIAGGVYRATPLAALNSGTGGFVVDTFGASVGLAELPFIISGGGVAITTGVKGFLPIPFGATIIGWSIIADQAGSISIDILRANNAVPSVSIVGGGTKPTLTAAQFVGNTAPSGWATTLLAAQDYLGFSVASVATVTQATLTLFLAKI